MKKVLLVSSCSDRPGAAQWLPWLLTQSSRLGKCLVFEVSTISILKKASESMKNSPCYVLGGLEHRGLASPGGGATFSYRVSQCRLRSPSVHVLWSPWEQKSWCESPFAQKSASLGTWPISLSTFLLVKHPDLPGTLLNGPNLNHNIKALNWAFPNK